MSTGSNSQLLAATLPSVEAQVNYLKAGEPRSRELHLRAAARHAVGHGRAGAAPRRAFATAVRWWR